MVSLRYEGFIPFRNLFLFSPIIFFDGFVWSPLPNFSSANLEVDNDLCTGDTWKFLGPGLCSGDTWKSIMLGTFDKGLVSVLGEGLDTLLPILNRAFRVNVDI